MILNTTHQNPEHKKLIADKVGQPFSLVQKLRMKGVGSKRMIIGGVSPNLMTVINKVSDINYGSIELRPKGILVHIAKGHKNFTWVIPYYRLVVYKTNGSSIHADGKFVHFENTKTFRENASFFKKLIIEKIKYEQNFALPN